MSVPPFFVSQTLRLFGEEAVEHFEHGVGDRLAELRCGTRQRVLVHVARGDRKGCPFVRHDLLRALDGPLRKLGACADFGCFHCLAPHLFHALIAQGEPHGSTQK